MILPCLIYYSLMSRILAALFALVAVPLAAEDWPQFLGPSRNGVYAGADLAAAWPATGPAVVWKRDVSDILGLYFFIPPPYSNCTRWSLS